MSAAIESLAAHRPGRTNLFFDTDADGLTDSDEVALGLDATALDSDYDGVSDAFEVELGTDPSSAGNPTEGWGYPAEDELGTDGAGGPVSVVDDAGPD